MSKNNREIEVKLRVRDAVTLRARLKRLRARKIVPRTYELNTVFDTTSGGLARCGQLIRIRTERPDSTANERRLKRRGSTVLTYKGPSRLPRGTRNPAGASAQGARFKVKREVEVLISSGDQMKQILQILGLRPVFHYEKFRTTYTLPGIRDLKVEFDETPVGLFLELEGKTAAIDRAARLLGYSGSEYITRTYGALHIADCRHKGIRPSDMLFPQTKKLL